MQYVHSLQSEWLKTRRSTASWLCIIGGFFIPLIYFIYFLKENASINDYDAVDAWKFHFQQLWQNMAIFLLPLGLILSTSLIAQVEYRNNTWKQLHTTPQSFTNIFVAKFSVIVLMTLKFFLFFNIGILITGYVPSLLFDGKLPDDPLPVMYFLQENASYFLACLPIMALQFLLSMNFKNFLVSIGMGFLGLVGTLIGMNWEHIVISPFSYCTLYTLRIPTNYNLVLLSVLYFLVLMLFSYSLYIRKKEKG